MLETKGVFQVWMVQISKFLYQSRRLTCCPPKVKVFCKTKLCRGGLGRDCDGAWGGSWGAGVIACPAKMRQCGGAAGAAALVCPWFCPFEPERGAVAGERRGVGNCTGRRPTATSSRLLCLRDGVLNSLLKGRLWFLVSKGLAVFLERQRMKAIARAELLRRYLKKADGNDQK